MAGTAFSTLYDLIRVTTGNDDPDIGSDILSDTRLDTLIKTAALTLRSYCEAFPDIDTSAGDLSLASDPGNPITSTAIVVAIGLVAANKYFVGISHKEGMENTLSLISAQTRIYLGEPISEVNEYRLENYKILVQQRMQSTLLTY